MVVTVHYFGHGGTRQPREHIEQDDGKATAIRVDDTVSPSRSVSATPVAEQLSTTTAAFPKEIKPRNLGC